MLAFFEIPVNDFHRAVNFYKTIYGGLELEIIEEEGSELALLPTNGYSGSVQSALVKSAYHKVSDSTGVALYLHAFGKMDEIVGRIEEAGGTIVAPPQNAGRWGMIAFFKDTEGNFLGLMEP